MIQAFQLECHKYTVRPWASHVDEQVVAADLDGVGGGALVGDKVVEGIFLRIDNLIFEYILNARQL